MKDAKSRFRDAPLALSQRGVCREYGVDQRTVQEAIASGDLPAYRLGKRRLTIFREDVEAWIRKSSTHRCACCDD